MTIQRFEVSGEMLDELIALKVQMKLKDETEVILQAISLLKLSQLEVIKGRKICSLDQNNNIMAEFAFEDKNDIQS